MAITKIQSESLNLADTYDFTGTVTGAGGNNKPAFLAYASSSQSGISQNSYTKLTNYGVEVFDTDNKFANGSTFTPGELGKYFIFGTVYSEPVDGSRTFLAITKNQSIVITSAHVPGAQQNFPQQVSGIVNVTNASDTIELYINSTGTATTAHSSGVEVKFGGFKLIT